MDLKEYLTNEKVCKKFGSQFELVNYAIKLAANMIMTGRDSRVKIDSQNRAMQVLSEILNDKDSFDELYDYEEEEQVNSYHQQQEYLPIQKIAERKKGRKLLAD